MAGSLTCREAQSGLSEEGLGRRAGGVGLPVPSTRGSLSGRLRCAGSAPHT